MNGYVPEINGSNPDRFTAWKGGEINGYLINAVESSEIRAFVVKVFRPYNNELY